MSTTASPKVLFFSPFGSWHVHEQIAAVFGAALRLRDVPVAVVRCDGLFKDNCYILVHSGNKAEDCAICYQRGTELFEQAFQLPIIQLRSYITAEDVRLTDEWVTSLPKTGNIRAFSYKGLPLGEWVAPIVCSYFAISPAQFDRPEVQALHLQYMGYSLITYLAMDRLITETNPSHIFMYQAAGMVQTAVYELARSRGIEIVSHTSGRHAGSYALVRNGNSSCSQSRRHVVNKWADIPLIKSEVDEVKGLFSRRQKGLNENYAPYYKVMTDPKNVRQRLNIPDDARIVSLFSSSEYERIYLSEYNEIPHQHLMISDIIESFRGRPEYLVIRHHPQIGGGPKQIPDYEFVSRIYEHKHELPPNVRIVMSVEDLTSYGLMWNSDATVHFYSTTGIEAVAQGAPSTMLTECLHSLGTTSQIVKRDRESLNTYINEMLSYTLDWTDLRRMYRYIYAFTYRHSVQYRSFKIRTNSGDADIRITHIDELKEGNDPALDRFCNYVTKGSEFYDLPTSRDLERDPSIEEAECREELREVQKIRAQLREDIKTAPRMPNDKTVFVLYHGGPSAANEKLFLKSLADQRYQNISKERISFNGDLTPEMIDLLLKQIPPHAAYVVLTSDRFFYDESFVSESIYKLEEQKDKAGILWGAWYGSDAARLHTVLLMDHYKSETLGNLLNFSPHFRDLRNLFGLTLLRRETVENLLKLCRDDFPNHTNHLVQFFGSERMIVAKTPACRFVG